MSRSREQIIRDGYAAWNSGDLDTMLEFVHPELVWVTSGVFPGLRPSYSGREEFRTFWAEFTGPWEKLDVGIEELYELDDGSALLRVRFYARGRQGIEVDRSVTNHLVMRDDMLLRFKAFEHWHDAVEELDIEDPAGRS